MGWLYRVQLLFRLGGFNFFCGGVKHLPDAERKTEDKHRHQKPIRRPARRTRAAVVIFSPGFHTVRAVDYGVARTLVNVAVQVVVLLWAQTGRPIYTLVAIVMVFVASTVQAVPFVE
jgi:hypothetical protein